jgi:hypothetical protein
MSLSLVPLSSPFWHTSIFFSLPLVFFPPSSHSAVTRKDKTIVARTSSLHHISTHRNRFISDRLKNIIVAFHFPLSQGGEETEGGEGGS